MDTQPTRRFTCAPIAEVATLTAKPESSLMIIAGWATDNPNTPSLRTPVISLADMTTSTIISTYVGEPIVVGIRNAKSPVLHTHYVAKSNRLVVALGTRLASLTPTPDGSFLLGGVLSPSKVLQGNTTAGDLTLELPMAEAQRFLAALRADLLPQPETTRSWGLNPSDVQALVIQLTRQTFKFGATTSAAAATVALTLPYALMKQLTNALISHSNNPNLYQSAFHLQEMHRRVGQRIPHQDSFGFNSPYVPQNMNVEANRLASFAHWTTSTNPDATPANLAGAGFYYDPNPHLSNVGGKKQFEMVDADGCRHFNNKHVLVSGWSTRRSVADEAHKNATDYGHNKEQQFKGDVPIAYSLALSKGIEAKATLDAIASSPHSTLIAMRSDRVITIYETALELSEQFSFPVVVATVPAEPHAELVSIVGHVIVGDPYPHPPSAAITTALAETRQWLDWCTVGITVYATKGVHSGRTMTINEVSKENKTTVHAITDRGDVEIVDIKNLLPLSPLEGQRALVINGEMRGTKVQVHSLPNASSAIVRVVPANMFISVPRNSLAALSKVETDATDDFISSPLRDHCVIVTAACAETTVLHQYVLDGDKMARKKSPSPVIPGRPLFSAYSHADNSLFVLARNTSSTFVVSRITCDVGDEFALRFVPSAKGSTIKIAALKDGDEPVAMQVAFSEELNAEVLIVLTRTGKLYLYAIESGFEIMQTHDVAEQREDLEPRSFATMESKVVENGITCVTTDGDISTVVCTGLVQAKRTEDATTATPSSQSLRAHLKTVLPSEPITAEALSTLSAMSNYVPVPLRNIDGAPVHGDTIVTQRCVGGDGSSTNLAVWDTSSHFPPCDVAYTLDLSSLKRLDAIEIGVQMATSGLATTAATPPSLPLEHHVNSISIQWLDGRLNWNTLLDRYDLTNIVALYPETCTLDSPFAPFSLGMMYGVQNGSAPVRTRRIRVVIHAATEVKKVAVRFSSLDPTLGDDKISQLAFQSRAVNEIASFHTSLLSLVCAPHTNPRLRIQCFTKLRDILCRNPTLITERIQDVLGLGDTLGEFIDYNIIQSGAEIAEHAGRLLLALQTTASVEFKVDTLKLCVEKKLREAASQAISYEGLASVVALVNVLWKAQGVLAPQRCVELLIEIASELHAARSIFYNVLRRDFSLYGHVLETDSFAPESDYDYMAPPPLPEKKTATAAGAPSVRAVWPTAAPPQPLQRSAKDDSKSIEKLKEDFDNARTQLVVTLEEYIRSTNEPLRSEGGDGLRKIESAEVRDLYEISARTQRRFFNAQRKLYSTQKNSTNSSDDVRRFFR